MYALGVCHEEVKHVEFARSEVDVFPVDIATFVVAVKAQGAEGDVGFARASEGVVVRAVSASEHGAYARYHLGYGERFGDIVVGSDVEPHHCVVLTVEGGAEYDGDEFGLGVVAHPFCKVESAQALHHYVDDDELEDRQVHSEGAFGRVGGLHFIALLFKSVFQYLAVRLFVVNNKYLGSHCSLLDSLLL